MLRPTLYYSLLSPPSRSCLLLAKLIGLKLNLRPINFVQRENESEWFQKLNPRLTVPVLVDHSTAMCESNAILSYMVSKYSLNDNLYPKCLLKKAKVDELLHFSSGVLSPCVSELLGGILEGEALGYTVTAILNCYKAYETLEGYLQNSRYVAGDYMTIADISIDATMVTLNKVVPVPELYPKTIEWLEQMKLVPHHYKVNERGAYKLYGRLLSELVENRLRAAEQSNVKKSTTNTNTKQKEINT